MRTTVRLDDALPERAKREADARPTDLAGFARMTGRDLAWSASKDTIALWLLLAGLRLVWLLSPDGSGHPLVTDAFDHIPGTVTLEWLAAIALSVGRAKDHARILALLDSEATTPDELATLASRHGLDDRWASFKRRFLDA